MKEAVRACELSEDNDKFYNSSVDRSNKYTHQTLAEID